VIGEEVGTGRNRPGREFHLGRRHEMPKFIVFVPASEESEAGELPGEEILAAMTSYNEELAKAGVLIDLSGLQPTSKGVRVRFEGGKATVIEGPVTETKGLVAGYWLIETKSRDEAIDWVKRAPFRQFTEQGGEVEVQVRQLYELDDFNPSPAVDRARQIEQQLGRR
jgi:hypothetical protein